MSDYHLYIPRMCWQVVQLLCTLAGRQAGRQGEHMGSYIVWYF